MTFAIRKTCRIRLTRSLVLLLLSGPALAQLQDLRLPINLVADSTDYDGKSSMLMFKGLRLNQGEISIQADEGRASKLEFADSVWHLEGNVVIDTANGHVESDTAYLQFAEYELTHATITGMPASFELRRPDSEETTYAEAGRLEYDFTAGIVEFSEDATITEGGNQISSNYLVYNIREQRINAKSGGDGDQQVKITYTPRPADEDVDALVEEAESQLEEAAEEASEDDDVPPGDGGS